MSRLVDGAPAAKSYNFVHARIPEVETVRRGLAPHMEERHSLSEAGTRRCGFRFQPISKRSLPVRIQSLSRRAKCHIALIQPVVAPELLWLSHLGMSGRFQVTPPSWAPDRLANYKHGVADAVAQKHVHVTLDLDDGTCVTYADPRRFGFMDLTPASTTSRFLADLGPEPMGNEFNADYLLAACADRQSR